MPIDDLPVAESTSVQLTRIEGVLNGIDYKVSDLLTFKMKTEDRLTHLESTTQALHSEATAREDKAIALALALKNAEESRRQNDETQRRNNEAQRLAEERTWSPFSRAVLAIGAIAATAGTIISAFAIFTH